MDLQAQSTQIQVTSSMTTSLPWDRVTVYSQHLRDFIWAIPSMEVLGNLLTDDTGAHLVWRWLTSSRNVVLFIQLLELRMSNHHISTH